MLTIRGIVLAVAAGVGLAGAPCLGQACTPSWTQFGHTGLNSFVRASTVFDFDGPGPLPPRLVVAGDFTRVGQRAVEHVAYWDGADWQGIGAELVGSVHDLAVFDEDGPGPLPQKLAVSGHFFDDSMGMRAVAVWDGSGWMWVSGAAGQTGFDLAGLSGPGPGGSALFVGTHQGVFRHQGGTLVPLGATNKFVEAVAVYDPDGGGPAPQALYAAGHFTTVAGVPASIIARWDGSVWSEVGGGIQGWGVLELFVYDADDAGPALPRLLAGGDFDSAGGVPMASVASWDGSAWSSMPGLQGWVTSFVVTDLDGPGPQGRSLLSAGGINQTSGPGSPSIARWDGTAWLACGNGFNNAPYTLTEFDEDGAGPLPARAVAGGFFTSNTAAPFATIPHLARWDGQGWGPMGPIANATMNDSISSLAMHDEDGAGPLPAYLVAGGRFRTAGGIAALRAARWNGQGWSAMGAGLGNEATAMTSFDPDGAGPALPALIAGGWFSINGSGFRRWDGAAWAAMPGPAANGFIAQALATVDLDGAGPLPLSLYAVGERLGSSGSLVLRWDGAVWAAITGPTSGRVYAAAAFDPDGAGPLSTSLVIGGNFGAIGTGFYNNIARWDGAAWHALGTGANGEVGALAVYDEDGDGPALPALFAGGRFNSAGSASSVGGIARWNGAAWSRVGPQFPPVSFSHINAMAVFDRDGPAGEPGTLIVAGGFSATLGFTGVAARGAASWNGQAWSALGAGVDVEAYDLAAFDEDGAGPGATGLYFGGRFRNADGEPSMFFARWGCPGPAVCYANCDGSTAAPALNTADFTCFLQAYSAGNSYANCDGSTAPPAVNVADFTCFLQRFAAGCP